MIKKVVVLCLSLIFVGFFASCSTAVSAEEYYSIGMAFYEMGKYEDAEKWLGRATGKSKTVRASEYNLGRIAFETGRYTEASKYFRRILRSDPANLMVLRAEAYTQIKLANLKEAEKYYDKVLTLAPENADAGYNHALILFAMDKPVEAEKVLQKYEYQLEDNKDNLLLLARVQKAQKKLDSIDTYDKWLQKNDAPEVHYEYALALEDGGFYAKALEEVQTAQKNFLEDTASLKKSTVHFTAAKLMLIADPTDDVGITELTAAFNEGFNDKEVITALTTDERLPKTRQDEIRRVYDTITAQKKAEAEAASAENK